MPLAPIRQCRVIIERHECTAPENEGQAPDAVLLPQIRQQRCYSEANCRRNGQPSEGIQALRARIVAQIGKSKPHAPHIFVIYFIIYRSHEVLPLDLVRAFECLTTQPLVLFPPAIVRVQQGPFAHLSAPTDLNLDGNGEPFWLASSDVPGDEAIQRNAILPLQLETRSAKSKW